MSKNDLDMAFTRARSETLNAVRALGMCLKHCTSDFDAGVETGKVMAIVVEIFDGLFETYDAYIQEKDDEEQ